MSHQTLAFTRSTDFLPLYEGCWLISAVLPPRVSAIAANIAGGYMLMLLDSPPFLRLRLDILPRSSLYLASQIHGSNSAFPAQQISLSGLSCPLDSGDLPIGPESPSWPNGKRASRTVMARLHYWHAFRCTVLIPETYSHCSPALHRCTGVLRTTQVLTTATTLVTARAYWAYGERNICSSCK